MMNQKLKEMFIGCLDDAWDLFGKIWDTKGLEEEPMDADEVELFSQLFQCHLMLAHGNLSQHEFDARIDDIANEWGALRGEKGD